MKVSICIPAYKHADFLKRCIDSILLQDFEDYEVIITDDSPNEELSKLIESYNNERFLYYKNIPALGSPENWNAGIRLAKGEYIKVIHHDDWLASNDCLRKYVALLDENRNVDIAFSASCDIDNKGTRKEHIAQNPMICQLRKNPELLFIGNKLGAPSCCIFRNKETVLFDPKLKWVVDTEFYIRIIKEKYNFTYTPDILVNIGISEFQATQTCSADIKLMIEEKIYLFNKLQLGTKSLKYRQALLRLMGREKIWTNKDLSKLLPNCKFKLSKKDSIIAVYYYIKRKVHDICCN